MKAKFFIMSILVVFIGTLAALAIAGMYAKQQLTNSTNPKNLLASLLG